MYKGGVFTSLFGWMFLALSCAALLARLWPMEHPYAIAFVGFTPFVLILIVVALLFAWFGKQLLLLVAAVGSLGFYFITMPSASLVVGCQPEQADEEIVIYTSNVLFETVDADSLVASIEKYDPDVIVLQEMTSRLWPQVSSDSRLASYTSRVENLPGFPSHGVVILSKLEMTASEEEQIGRSRSAAATFEVSGGRTFGVSAVHTKAPVMKSTANLWKEELELLSDFDTSQPYILAGDFNATKDHKQFRDLLSSGWHDAQDVKGCGLDATYPAKGLPLAFYQLDHILTTDDFETLRVEIDDVATSDHKSVIAAVRIKE